MLRVRPGNARGRVLFIDSSVVLRTALKELFKNEDGLEAFTSSPDPSVSLLNVAKVRPDLAVLDADGDWETLAILLRNIREREPKLTVVLITSDARRQANLSARGETFGVADCWLKTEAFKTPDANLRNYVISHVSRFVELGSVGNRLKAKSDTGAVAVRATGKSTKKTVIVIGVSTGGPDALSVLLPLLPSDLSVPVLIVQHTLAAFTSLLVERLQKRTGLTVLEAQDGTPIIPGQILVAPGNRHMLVEPRQGQIVTALNDGPPENSCRPAVDPLFRSAARVFGGRTLGVVLTGMGQDGLLGCRELKRVGATILVQDQASSTVWGMPGQVAQAGIADKVLDLKELAPEILREIGFRAKERRI